MDVGSRLVSPVMVAFAEDHVSVRKGIVSFLHELGGVNVIIEAGDGRELIQKVEQVKKKPDVCLVDIIMPKMNGFETVAEIKKKWPNIKVLVLTTYTEDLYAVKMIRMGVNGYLSKACSPEELRDAIVAVHEKGNYYSDFFMQKTALAIQDERLKIPSLTEKELWFLELCCSDMTYLKISQMMRTTPKSVEGYRDSLFKKLHVNNRVGLVLFAIRTGIVAIERPMTD